MLNQKSSGSWFSRTTHGLIRPVVRLGILGTMLSQAGIAYPCIYTMASGNVSINFEPGSQGGLSDLTVDGQNQLNQQGLWYRIGNTGPEKSVALSSVSQPTASTLQATYATSKVRIDVLYSLVGGTDGSGVASLSEQIRIQNRTTRAQDFHLFQYTDWDFLGTTELGRNLAGLFDEALVTGNDSSVTEGIDTAVTPGANHGVAGANTLSLLNDAYPTTLTDNAGPSTNASWTFEWDSRIAGKGTLILSQVINLDPVPAPEPSALGLILMGLIPCSRLLKRG
jgi:hypothetical protein